MGRDVSETGYKDTTKKREMQIFEGLKVQKNAKYRKLDDTKTQKMRKNACALAYVEKILYLCTQFVQLTMLQSK